MSQPIVPECCICMDSINSSINNCTTPCGHRFCFQCLAKALEQNNTCPMCRSVLMEVPDEEETLYSDDDEYETDSDDESVEQFDDDALRAFRGFMQRVEYEPTVSASYPAEAMEVEDSKEDHIDVDEEEEEDEDLEEEEDNTTTEEIGIMADVETITETLQKRGITMLDLVALLTDRPSTKVAKHTDRFMNALETILDKAIDDCDRVAQSQAQVNT
jgi:hypothetical protein